MLARVLVHTDKDLAAFVRILHITSQVCRHRILRQPVAVIPSTSAISSSDYKIPHTHSCFDQTGGIILSISVLNSLALNGLRIGYKIKRDLEYISIMERCPCGSLR